jgi:predicted nicotinamide N-methyase
MQHALHKGPFSRALLAGRSMLELGSGAGLAGISAAMHGCHVTLTDVAAVLALLRENVSLNFSSKTWANSVTLREQFGSLAVRELDWTKPEQLEGFGREYDYIVGTDCVYHEHLILDLLRVVLHCSCQRTRGVIHWATFGSCLFTAPYMGLCPIHSV